jgi:hypothetical protein
MVESSYQTCPCCPPKERKQSILAARFVPQIALNMATTPCAGDIVAKHKVCLKKAFVAVGDQNASF